MSRQIVLRRAVLIAVATLTASASSRALHAQSAQSPTVSAAYRSEAEGRQQSFQVTLPSGYDESKSYPLLVQLSGGQVRALPNEPFIRIRPSGRGVWGYRSMSRYDVVMAIRHTVRSYNIDQDRVYLTGASAGGTGVMHTAAQRPDLFAAVVPLVAFGNDLPLENFRNLPIRCEHGVNDWTSAICNVRVQFQKLAVLGYDAVLHEHPTAGHGIGVPPRDTMKWLFRQRRQRSPHRIVYSCEHPRDGRAYWVTIQAFVDPHQIASVQANVTNDSVKITTHNVRRLSLDPTTMPFSRERPIDIDGSQLALSGARDSQIELTRDDRWEQATVRQDHSGPHPYGAGAAANLFQGEPLLVIYGTNGQPDEIAFLRNLAVAFSRCGGPTHRPAAVRFPVHADSQLNNMDLGESNLLLVGTAANNLVIRRLADRLPYRIDGIQLHVEPRENLPLDNSILGCHYYNPEHPGRLLYIVSPFVAASDRPTVLKNPREFLAGSDGFKMIDQPDLWVRGVHGKLRREMQFGHNWEFLVPSGQMDMPPQKFADRTHLGFAHLRVMKAEADVDFGLWWGPDDPGLFGGYDFNWLNAMDPAVYTRADYAVRRRETETMVGSLPGAELAEIYRRWVATNELISWPTIVPEQIDAARQYRIVIPMDLVPKLGTRRKVLSDVRPGPDIRPERVARAIFDN